MQTIDEIKAALGVVEGSLEKVYEVTLQGNVYAELSNHATANIQVTSLDGVYYAATLGEIDPSAAKQIA